jgi:hypothetical protein
MYCLSPQQIDYILNDIRARGVKLESLQLNLLDHVCCIVEQNLEADGNFEEFYKATIKTFYKDELREIEVETINLLTFKNYYAMKKIMIASGTISAILLSTGILFKFQQWPGASMLLVVGIASFSLLFLPLVFTLKAKEERNAKDKLIAGLGTLAAILLSMGILFKIMHWPGANVMGIGALGIMGLVFLPVYFFTGIRSAETKVNTIVSSIIIVACCGLFLALVRSPAGSQKQRIADTHCFVKTEQLFKTEQQLTQLELKNKTTDPAHAALSGKIVSLCQDLKTHLLEGETGLKNLDADFESKNTLIGDGPVENSFPEGTPVGAKLKELQQTVEQYNAAAKLSTAGIKPIAVKATILETSNERVLAALNDFISIQIAVLQNQRQLASAE